MLFNEPPNFLTKGALSTRNEGFFFRVGFDTLAFLALEALASFLALRKVLVSVLARASEMLGLKISI